jgi:hypothetical protein
MQHRCKSGRPLANPGAAVRPTSGRLIAGRLQRFPPRGAARKRGEAFRLLRRQCLRGNALPHNLRLLFPFQSIRRSLACSPRQQRVVRGGLTCRVESKTPHMPQTGKCPNEGQVPA